MIALPSLRAFGWQLAALGAAASALALTVALILTDRARDRLDVALNDPTTGYVARLARCEADLTSADGVIATQQAATAALKADSDRRLSEAQKAAQSAQAALRAARKPAQEILTGRGKADACTNAEHVLRGGEG